MYCPQCGYILRGLPDVHRCPECDFVYVRKVTTSSEPLPISGWRNPWAWLAVPLALLVLAYPVFAALHTLLVDPNSPFLDSTGGSQPIVLKFEALCALFAVGALVVAGFVNWPRPTRFWIHRGGVGWLLRGEVSQLIPWGIITEVHLRPVRRRVVLELSIGGTVQVPRRAIKSEGTPTEVCSRIRQRLADFRSGDGPPDLEALLEPIFGCERSPQPRDGSAG